MYTSGLCKELMSKRYHPKNMDKFGDKEGFIQGKIAFINSDYNWVHWLEMYRFIDY